MCSEMGINLTLLKIKKEVPLFQNFSGSGGSSGHDEGNCVGANHVGSYRACNQIRWYFTVVIEAGLAISNFLPLSHRTRRLWVIMDGCLSTFIKDIYNWSVYKYGSTVLVKLYV